MRDDKITHASKKLSWLLRHGAREAGVAMDAAGWVAVADALRALRITRDVLEQTVDENNKSRLELRGERIRASQGHSLAGVPVTREALEASWDEHPGVATIWHGTGIAAVTGIARDGIHAGERTHVHLAAAIDSAVGKRAGVAVMLGASPERLRERGLPVYRSPNGVLLVRHVPVDCLVELRAISAKARAEVDTLKRELGLAAPAARVTS